MRSQKPITYIYGIAFNGWGCTKYFPDGRETFTSSTKTLSGYDAVEQDAIEHAKRALAAAKRFGSQAPVFVGIPTPA